MAQEKIKLNKTELKNQKDLLKQREEFLPVLELKKQQLQLVVDSISPDIEERQARIAKTHSRMQRWAGLLTEPTDVPLEKLYEIAEVKTELENVAGVDVPSLREVVFRDVQYDLFATPPLARRGQDRAQRAARPRGGSPGT